jgi:hypothetical protein
MNQSSTLDTFMHLGQNHLFELLRKADISNFQMAKQKLTF